MSFFLLRNYQESLPHIFLWLSLLMRPQSLFPICTPLVTEVMEEFTFAFAQFSFLLKKRPGPGLSLAGERRILPFFFLTLIHH